MKRNKRWLCIIFTLLIFLVSSTSAFGEENMEDSADKTLAPYFYVEGSEPMADDFPLKGTSVTANINGVIAETFVTQTYANIGPGPINATYVFPASGNVTVHGMKMEIGDQIITAKIKEKEEAKEEFEEAKSEGKSASLLEQQRPNVFTMDVANVMPGDTIRIELHYTELMVPTEGTYEFVFPTVVGPRYASPWDETADEDEQWVSTPYLDSAYLSRGNSLDSTYDITVNLSSGVPITELSSPSHKVNISRENDSTASVTLYDPSDYAGNRDFILDYKLTGQEINCGLMLNSGETENFFMLMVQPPERVKPEDIPPREYLFVLDVSGSMIGYPLDTAKELITNLVSGLRETDTFNLILFSNDSVLMSPESVPANADNIWQAVELIEQQEGGGGTELAPALEQALAIPRKEQVSRSIAVITDGYMSDESSIFEIINKNIASTSFFPFGIGSSVNRYLIDGMAKAGLGESFVVTDPDACSQTADRFRTYIQSPVLTDIHVDYDGFETYDIEPPVLPTLFAQRPIVVFGKWRGEPSGTIRITGKAGNQDYTAEIPADGPAPMEANSAIRYLWARTKVERLMDYGFSEEDAESIRKEVTQIGLDYSMMTPYTSFIAVTETIRNKDGDATDVNQPLPLPQNVSELAVGGYTTGAEPADIFMIAGLVLILTISSIRGRKKRRSAPLRGKQHELP